MIRDLFTYLTVIGLYEYRRPYVCTHTVLVKMSKMYTHIVSHRFISLLKKSHASEMTHQCWSWSPLPFCLVPPSSGIGSRYVTGMVGVMNSNGTARPLFVPQERMEFTHCILYRVISRGSPVMNMKRPAGTRGCLDLASYCLHAHTSSLASTRRKPYAMLALMTVG